MSVSKKTFGAVLEEAAKELVNDDVRFAHSIDTSKTVVSEKTLRRVRRQIKNYDTTPVRARTLSFRRAVAAVLVVCILSFGLCMSIDAVREKIIDTIIQWYDKFVAVFYVAEDVPLDVIEEYKEPTLFMNGVEKKVLVKNNKFYSIIYTKDGEVIIKYHQMPISATANKINNENCNIEELEINDNEYILYSNENSKVIVWVDYGYRFVISLYDTNIQLDELLRIAESIKKNKK